MFCHKMLKNLLAVLLGFAGLITVAKLEAWGQQTYEIGCLADLDFSKRDLSKAKGKDAPPMREVTQEVTQLLSDHLDRMLHDSFEVSLNQSVFAPPTIHVKEIKDITINQNQTHIQGKIIFSDATYAPLSFTSRLKLMAWIPVPKHSLDPGHLIQKEDLEMKKVSHDGSLKNMAHDMASIVGREVRKYPLKAHLPIRPGDLKKPQIAKSGQVVIARVQSPRLSVETQGVLMDAGAVGDRVRLKSMDGQKILQGRLMNAQVVHVDQGLMPMDVSKKKKQPTNKKKGGRHG